MTPPKHQEYVDRHWPKLSPEQVARALQLWEEKQEIDPDMPNRGFSFVKILEYVAEGETPPAEDHKKTPERMDDPAKSASGATPEEGLLSRSTPGSGRPNRHEATSRKATPVKIPAEQTIDVARFGVSEDDLPPVVLLPESRLAVTGRVRQRTRSTSGSRSPTRMATSRVAL